MSLRADSLDWNLVRTFVAVVRGGSLSAGARELGLAHPTVARHIQQLEEALGLVLFDRTRAGLQINDAGARLAAAARAMQRGALAFESVSDEVRRAPVSHVRVTAAELISDALPQMLAGALDAVQDLDAEFQVELQVTNSRLNLLQRDADFAVRHGQPDQQELIARRVGSLCMNLYASRDYIAQFGPVTPENLAEQRFIDGMSEPHMSNAMASQGMTLDPRQLVFKSDSILSWRSAMLAGFGIAGLPEHVANDERACVIDPGRDPFSIDVWLVARPEVRNNAGLKAVFDALGEQLYAFLRNEPVADAKTQVAGSVA